MSAPTQSERLIQAVDILRRHNEWRRCDYGSTPNVLRVHLVQAIDIIVDLVPGLIRKAEAKSCTGR